MLSSQSRRPWDDEIQPQRKRQPTERRSQKSNPTRNTTIKHSSSDSLAVISLKSLANSWSRIQASIFHDQELHDIFACIPPSQLSILMKLLNQRKLLGSRAFPIFTNCQTLPLACCCDLQLPLLSWERCIPRYVRNTTKGTATPETWEMTNPNCNIDPDSDVSDLTFSTQGWMNITCIDCSRSNMPLHVLCTILSTTKGLEDVILSGWKATSKNELSYNLLLIENSGMLDGIQYMNFDNCPWFDNKCLLELIRGRKLRALRLFSCHNTLVTLSSTEVMAILRRNGSVTKVTEKSR